MYEDLHWQAHCDCLGLISNSQSQISKAQAESMALWHSGKQVQQTGFHVVHKLGFQPFLGLLGVVSKTSVLILFEGMMIPNDTDKMLLTFFLLKPPTNRSK